MLKRINQHVVVWLSFAISQSYYSKDCHKLVCRAQFIGDALLKLYKPDHSDYFFPYEKKPTDKSYQVSNAYDVRTSEDVIKAIGQFYTYLDEIQITSQKVYDQLFELKETLPNEHDYSFDLTI